MVQWTHYNYYYKMIKSSRMIAQNQELCHCSRKGGAQLYPDLSFYHFRGTDSIILDQYFLFVTKVSLCK